MPLQADTIQKIKEFTKNYEQSPQYEIILKKEADRFLSILKNNIKKYLDDYSPVLYQRTGDLVNSLSSGSVFTVGNEMQINVSFGDGAIKKAGTYKLKNGKMGKRTMSVFLPVLLENGWQVSDSAWFSNIPRYGHNPAQHIITNSINEFKKYNPYNVKFDINWDYFSYHD